MTSELERLATEHADRISMHLEDEHNVTMIWHQAYEAFKASAKAVLEFALNNAYGPITATVNKPRDYVVSISDLEKFVEGDKNDNT